MSHKSGHIIIQAVQPLPSINDEQRSKLSEIQQRDEYNVQDRLYLGMLVASIADDPAD